MVVLFAVACTDDIIVGEEANPLADDKGIGQLVLFSTGNAGNVTTRADVCPYMEQDGRFVCKMFYHANADDIDASPFDTISTPITSWLRVNNNEGNSVYWRRDYDMAGVDVGHQDYLDYGFDSRAQYFYWRNRLDHIFLGFTDFSKLKTNTYGTTQGKLFMYPEFDDAKKTKTGEMVSWLPVSCRTLSFDMVEKPNPDYDPDDPENGEPATIEVLGLTGVNSSNSFPSYHGGSFPLSTKSSYYIAITQDQINAAQTKLNQLVDDADFLTDDEKTALKEDLSRINASEEENTAEGTFHNERWYVTFDPEAGDAFVDGALNFGAENIAIYSIRGKKNVQDVFAIAPANTFDLTRGTRTSMAEQPDPLIALTKMKPMGATQEANRVRLHFKHQFSQIQVNLVNAENTAEIRADNIVSVELLGVSERGYVFTNINPDGTQIPPSYDPVIIRQYTDEQLKENPYGTSFKMFDMGESKPITSLKSFNAIAFGQLQAIRITWKEEDYKDADGNVLEEGVQHVATYKVTVDDRNNSLVNLQSGYRYLYDFELRRGTIAFIRATIDGWQLDDALNYHTSGTITYE